MELSLPTGRPVEMTSKVASEHPQELERRFSLLSICGIAISTGESWVSLGGSLTVAIYNLGPPGVLYGLLVTSCLYWFVAASIAELASAIPSSGTVYHWASITAGPRYGRLCGWFAGWWNFLAWVMGTASLGSFMALQTVTVCVLRQVTFLRRPQLSLKRQHLCILEFFLLDWLAFRAKTLRKVCADFADFHRCIPLPTRNTFCRIGTFSRAISFAPGFAVCSSSSEIQRCRISSRWEHLRAASGFYYPS